MFLIDGPYVSNYLKQTLSRHQIPVVKTAFARKELSLLPIRFIEESEAILSCEENSEQQLYTNSENALEWIYSNLPGSERVDLLKQVKDKVLFRKTLLQIHPGFFFRGYHYSDLPSVNASELPYPIILKPAVGFFSLGVQLIEDESAWKLALNDLDELRQVNQGIYPTNVLDNSAFILEEVIPGDEFAIDCYFDSEGHVVILNMMKHLFASGADVNDRVYITSAGLMKAYLNPIQNYLDRLGALFNLKNFQAHIEVRIDGDEIMAIEINPLRFGGWCSTPDLSQYAWDMNIYEALINQDRPDWAKLCQLNPNTVFALIVLNNSTGKPGKDIQNFDYDALLKTIKKPLELRKTNFRQFPLFGFLMCRVPANDLSELHGLLHSDLTEYII